MSYPQRPRRIVEGSRVDRVLGIMERCEEWSAEAFRDLLLELSKDKAQAATLRNDILKRGLIKKTVRYEISDTAKSIMNRGAE